MAYATLDDIFQSFGKGNVLKWSNVDNIDAETEEGEQLIIDRIDWSLDQATEMINERLYGGPYTVPFDVIPKSIIRLCSELAGTILYDARRINDEEQETGDQLKAIRRNAEDFFRQVHGGKRRFIELESSTNYMQVVPGTGNVIDDDDLYGIRSVASRCTSCLKYS